MSQSLFVKYRGKGFWAYDVPTKILARHLVDAAVKRGAGMPEAWLQECIEGWRANAIVSEYGFYVDDGWTEDQVSTVRDLVGETCHVLRGKGTITGEEMETWRIFPRGHHCFPVEPSVEEGEAIRALLCGDLPDPPDGMWWLYGVPPGRSTTRRHS